MTLSRRFCMSRLHHPWGSGFFQRWSCATGWRLQSVKKIYKIALPSDDPNAYARSSKKIQVMRLRPHAAIEKLLCSSSSWAAGLEVGLPEGWYGGPIALSRLGIVTFSPQWLRYRLSTRPSMHQAWCKNVDPKVVHITPFWGGFCIAKLGWGCDDCTNHAA